MKLAEGVKEFEARYWKKKGYKDLQLLLLKYLPAKYTIGELVDLADEIHDKIDLRFKPPGGVTGGRIKPGELAGIVAKGPNAKDVTFTLQGKAVKPIHEREMTPAYGTEPE